MYPAGYRISGLRNPDTKGDIRQYTAFVKEQDIQFIPDLLIVYPLQYKGIASIKYQFNIHMSRNLKLRLVVNFRGF